MSDASDTTSWKLPPTIPSAAFRLVLQYLYLSDLPQDLTDSRSTATEDDILTSADKISKRLELDKLWEALLTTDRRLARQRYQDEVNRAQQQMDAFFREKILGHKMTVDSRRVGEIKWRHDNAIFADCLLAAEEPGDDDDNDDGSQHVDGESAAPTSRRNNGIPVGPSEDQSEPKRTRRTVVYPAHKAMLLRSPYFETMFSSSFKEAQMGDHLHVITVDCSPSVLEIVLSYLYTEKCDCPLDLALDLLYAADMLFLDKVKTKAAQVISTLGSGNNNRLVDRTHGAAGENENGNVVEMEPINIYDVINAAWELNVQRLEEFAARYLAYRLEDYIDDPEFAELIQQSAARLKSREETDTIELLDDIRYYLSERFRLRFEDAGLEEIMDDRDGVDGRAAAVAAAAQDEGVGGTGKELSGQPDVVKADAEARPGSEVETETEAEAEAEAEAKKYDQGGVKTLDGEVAEDEFASDAINYQVLLGKIDTMLEQLNLGA